MSDHPYPYVRVLRYCINCDKQIPARSGNYCWAPACQAAKKARKRATEKAWNAIHKPWRGRNYEHRADPPGRAPKRKCPFCGTRTINHFACDKCISDRAGIDTMYQTVM